MAIVSGMDKSNFRPYTRQKTGTPLIFEAHVVNDQGRVVRSCSHRHTRRNGHTGEYYATRCAARMAQQLNRGNPLINAAAIEL